MSTSRSAMPLASVSVRRDKHSAAVDDLSSRCRTHRGTVKLRGICRMIMIFRAHCKAICKKAKEISERTIINFTDFGYFEPSLDFLFDTKPYRASEKEWLSDKAKEILNIWPSQRTLNQLRYLQQALTQYHIFSDYPFKIQRSICEVCWYEKFDSKRLILRENAASLNVYMLLSGTVVQFESDNSTKLLCYLNKGVQFGELSFITGERRLASVLSTTEVELLVFTGQDFENIFMSGGRKTLLHNSDNIAFLKKISFLTHWPIDQLHENANSCFFHHFNKGQILCDDTRQSNWIYIVKEGVLCAWKKIECKNASKSRRKAALTNCSLLLPADNNLTQWLGEMKTLTQSGRRLTLDETYTRNTHLPVKAVTLPGLVDAQDRLGVVDYSIYLDDRKAQLRNKIRRIGKLRAIMNMQMADSRMRVQLKDGDSDQNQPSKHVQWASDNKVDEKSVLEKQQQQMSQMQSRLQQLQSHAGRETILSRLNANSSALLRPLAKSSNRPKCEYAEIARVYKGEHFGLSDVLFPDQPGLILVSNGADCIVISKKLFVQYCSPIEMDRLRNSENRFPSDDQLYQMYDNHRNWVKLRQDIYRRTVKAICKATQN